MMSLEGDMSNLKRHPPLQIIKWGRRIACITSNTRSAPYTRMNGPSAVTPQDCCQTGSLLVKQLVWRIRKRLKQYYLRRMKGNTVQYSYDPQSYAQNFDSDRPVDSPSPYAP